ncbi:hypothetical protein DPMN_005038 [Dreissena polymorpha]|uniref:Peptidase M1 membrane alanine aminopeptidase domain-containing protein n=1 Tax=Dreissena polymorpha TaxID=45954 RepID=A0A9D4RTI4_DREPO|nr:hypothetical protein DPMN_005038 [Dreissena polymorpha]
MAWWDDLWLNEGFARFVQYLGTDKLFPDWQMVSYTRGLHIHALHCMIVFRPFNFLSL